MDAMTRELQLRPPAELLIAPYHGRHQLMAQATGLSKAGRIEIIRARPTWNEQEQRWELPVRRLRSASPWPRRLTIAGSVLGFLAIIGWVLSTLTGTALAVLCLAALAGLAALVHHGRRPSVTTTVFVQTKVR